MDMTIQKQIKNFITTKVTEIKETKVKEFHTEWQSTQLIALYILFKPKEDLNILNKDQLNNKNNIFQEKSWMVLNRCNANMVNF